MNHTVPKAVRIVIPGVRLNVLTNTRRQRENTLEERKARWLQNVREYLAPTLLMTTYADEADGVKVS